MSETVDRTPVSGASPAPLDADADHLDPLVLSLGPDAAAAARDWWQQLPGRCAAVGVHPVGHSAQWPRVR